MHGMIDLVVFCIHYIKVSWSAAVQCNLSFTRLSKIRFPENPARRVAHTRRLFSDPVFLLQQTNAFMMLTEAAAYALLKRHCDALQDVTWTCMGLSRRFEWIDVTSTKVDLVLSPPGLTRSTTAKTARLQGAQARLALGVAHAVSCCWGYQPETNQPFWRNAIMMLWRRTAGREATEKLAVSASTFAHVGIAWRSLSHSTAVEHAFWVGFLHGTPACAALLVAVLNRLRPHLIAWQPPPLQVSLSHCYAHKSTLPSKDRSSPLPYAVDVGTVVEPLALRRILQAALETVDSAWTDGTHLHVMLDYRVGDDVDDMREILDLLRRVPALANPRITLHRLAIQLAPRLPPRFPELTPHYMRVFIDRARALGRLLRRLLSAHSSRIQDVALNGCSHTDFRLVGAALSAVALSTPPVEAFSCDGLFYATQQQDKILRLAWIAYTLNIRRHRSAGSHPSWLAFSLLSSGVTLNEQESRYIESLVVGGRPLRDVVGESLRMRFGGWDDQVARLHVQCFRLGSTVRLARGTRLDFEPLRAATDAYVALQIENDDVDVDLVAHVTDDGGSVAIVYPGYGLLWVSPSSVVSQWRIEDDVIMVDSDDPDEDTGTVTSLKLSFHAADEIMSRPWREFAHRIDTMLPLLASASLLSMSLDRAVIRRAHLVQMLEAFPHLQSLAIDRCVVESLDPLVDLYAHTTRQQQSRCITKLSILDVLGMEMRETLIDSDLLLDDVLIPDTLVAESLDWVPRLVHALTSGITNGVLRELFIDLSAVQTRTDERAMVVQLASAIVQSPRTLGRLHISCKHQLLSVCESQLAPLAGNVLQDPPRTRRAILSVLRAFGLALPEIGSTVLALAEGNVVRTITWDKTNSVW